MFRSCCAMAIGLAASLQAASPVVRFAVIHTGTADLLQSEFSGLEPGKIVRIDSIGLEDLGGSTWQRPCAIRVYWHLVNPLDVYQKVTRVQSLDTLVLPKSYLAGDPRAIAVPDTVYSCPSSGCVPVRDIRRVDNWLPLRTDCEAMCVLEDSVTAWNNLQARLRSYGNAVLVRPIDSGSGPGAWNRTTGLEDHSQLVAALPGNQGNWIRYRTVAFDAENLRTKESCGLGKCGSPSRIAYKTGAAEYIYDRTADPELRILETSRERLWSDTILKLGSTLDLTGSIRLQCGWGQNDTEVKDNPWLVVPELATESGIAASLAPTGCGKRVSAWKMSHDTVWLSGFLYPVPLSRILLPVSVRQSARVQEVPRLVSTGKGWRLDLPSSAEVVVRDLSGQVLYRSRSMDAGSHLLPVAASGLMLVELRSADGRTAFLGAASGR